MTDTRSPQGPLRVRQDSPQEGVLPVPTRSYEFKLAMIDVYTIFIVSCSQPFCVSTVSINQYWPDKYLVILPSCAGQLGLELRLAPSPPESLHVAQLHGAWWVWALALRFRYSDLGPVESACFPPFQSHCSSPLLN